MNWPAVSPGVVAAIAAGIGCGLTIAGVAVLAGLGWALIAGAVPPLAFAGIIARGLLRAG